MSWRPNRAFNTEIRRDPEIKHAAKGELEDAIPYIRQRVTAAGGAWMPEKGKRQLEVIEVAGETVLTNRDHGGHLMEWGSINNPPHAPMRRGVRAAGLRFRDLPK